MARFYCAGIYGSAACVCVVCAERQCAGTCLNQFAIATYCAADEQVAARIPTIDCQGSSLAGPDMLLRVERCAVSAAQGKIISNGDIVRRNADSTCRKAGSEILCIDSPPRPG